MNRFFQFSRGDAAARSSARRGRGAESGAVTLAGPPPASPAAGRLRPVTRLRDPKLAAGIVLVACSVLLGSWVVAAADDRVVVWSVVADLASGTELSAADLVQVPVRLDEAGAYVGVTSESPVGRRLARAVGAGELLPVDAVAVGEEDHRLITVPVEPMHGPLEVRHGDRVDVYVSPRDATGAVAQSRLVLAGALVADVGESADSASGEVAVVLDVAPGDAAQAVAASRSGVIDLVRVPAGAAGLA